MWAFTNLCKTQTRKDRRQLTINRKPNKNAGMLIEIVKDLLVLLLDLDHGSKAALQILQDFDLLLANRMH